MRARAIPLIRLVAGLVAAAVLAGVVAYAISQGSNAAELRACHRLNVLRATQNGNWLALYEALGRADREAPSLNLQADARKLAWVPLTNCPAAVNTNAPAPLPVPFVERRPSLAALRLGPEN